MRVTLPFIIRLLFTLYHSKEWKKRVNFNAVLNKEHNKDFILIYCFPLALGQPLVPPSASSLFASSTVFALNEKLIFKLLRTGSSDANRIDFHPTIIFSLIPRYSQYSVLQCSSYTLFICIHLISRWTKDYIIVVSMIICFDFVPRIM